MMMKEIQNKDITVVVQGPIDRQKTERCLKSVREALPGAKIILSTWEGSDIEGLDFDEVILSADPGGFPAQNIKNPVICNVNRQIVSTRNGINAVDTPYAAKLRTDFCIEHSGFLDWFFRYSEKDNVEHRVIVSDKFTRNPRIVTRKIRRAFHPSDIFFLDIQKI